MILKLENSDPVKAVIYVSYPSGSICRCINGDHILNAHDTSGYWCFQITQLGNWVVSCTDGTNSDTKVVEVRNQRVEKVNLTYWDGTLYDGSLGDADKNQYKEITGGWRRIIGEQNYQGGGTVKLNSTNLWLGYAPDEYTHTYASTINMIDLTHWNSISITFSGYGSLQIFTRNAVLGTRTISSSLALSSGGTVSLDISDLTGEYYIGFHCGGTWYESVGWDPSSLAITKVKLSEWTGAPSYDFNYISNAVGYIIIEGTSEEVKATTITKDATILSPTSTVSTKWICAVPRAGLWTVKLGPLTWTVLIGSGQTATITPKFVAQTVKPNTEAGFLSSATIEAINVAYVNNDSGGQTVTIGDV